MYFFSVCIFLSKTRMYIFPNRSGDGHFKFNNLKEIRAAVLEIKKLPELRKIYDEPVPKAVMCAHPKHKVYHTLTGYAEDLIWAVNNAFTSVTNEKPFQVQLYTYHGAPLHWVDRKILGFPNLSELKKDKFQF